MEWKSGLTRLLRSPPVDASFNSATAYMYNSRSLCKAPKGALFFGKGSLSESFRAFC